MLKSIKRTLPRHLFLIKSVPTKIDKVPKARKKNFGCGQLIFETWSSRGCRGHINPIKLDYSAAYLAS